ncbi:MAG: ABC transporter, ATP-binding protein, partial [Candidatus Moranbacteria bacterium GW2011_GWE1_49_15]
SGGQKQRVSIARALINDPDIILADEPVGNLDSESAQNVLEIFKEINEVDKKTLIMVTHNPEHLHYADRILHMKDGKKESEEINHDKRPKEAIKEELEVKPEEMSGELKLLMRTFKNLSLQQVGVLLIPFKAKQLLNHVLSELTEEQVSSAENILKEFLFKNIDEKTLEDKLDLDMSEGGAGWNRKRVRHFSDRVKSILTQVESIMNDSESSAVSISDYVIRNFNVHLDLESSIRFRSFIKLRIENKIDRFGLFQRLDAPKTLGGVGLYRGTADKIVREMELIMLLKYSA